MELWDQFTSLPLLVDIFSQTCRNIRISRMFIVLNHFSDILQYNINEDVRRRVTNKVYILLLKFWVIP